MDCTGVAPEGVKWRASVVERSKKPSSSIKSGEFFDQLRNAT
jgi:hypothetical protein